MTTTLRKIPEGWLPLSEDVASNADHEVNEETLTLLLQGGCFSYYPAWNWCGKVWYEDGQFHCEVWINRCHADTLSYQNFFSLKKALCEEFGKD